MPFESVDLDSCSWGLQLAVTATAVARMGFKLGLHSRPTLARPR